MFNFGACESQTYLEIANCREVLYEIPWLNDKSTKPLKDGDGLEKEEK